MVAPMMPGGVMTGHIVILLGKVNRTPGGKACRIAAERTIFSRFQSYVAIVNSNPCRSGGETKGEV
jgi:hypothetical protein